MRLNAPTKKVFWISAGIIVAAIAVFIVSFFVVQTPLLIVAFCAALVGAVLLGLGNVLKGF